MLHPLYHDIVEYKPLVESKGEGPAVTASLNVDAAIDVDVSAQGRPATVQANASRNSTVITVSGAAAALNAVGDRVVVQIRNRRNRYAINEGTFSCSAS